MHILLIICICFFLTQSLLWEQTKEHSGIDKDYYCNYFRNKKIGHAIKIKKTKQYKTPVDLKETYDIDELIPNSSSNITVTATSDEGKVTTFQARVRIDTPKEWEYYRHGGILHYVLRQLAT